MANGVGLFNNTKSNFYLDYNNDSKADSIFGFGPPDNDWSPVAGDFNGDGESGVGLYNGNGFLLNFDKDTGSADQAVGFGPPDNDWDPLAADFNGDGEAGIGLKKGHRFFLDNDRDGEADDVFGFGPIDNDWQPVVGDFNGDGEAGVGLKNGHRIFLDNDRDGEADDVFGFGAPGNDWTPIAGDFNGNGEDGIALKDGNRIMIDNDKDGVKDDVFGFGPPGNEWKPVAGNWEGKEGFTLSDAIEDYQADELPEEYSLQVPAEAPTLEDKTVQDINDADTVVSEAQNTEEFNEVGYNYTLNDSLQNLYDAAEAIVENASEYSLTESAVDYGTVSVEEYVSESGEAATLLDNATNSGEYEITETYSLEDSAANIVAEIDAATVSDADTVSLSGDQNATVSQATSLTGLDNFDGEYYLQDTFTNLWNVDGDDVFTNAEAYRISNEEGTELGDGILTAEEITFVENAANYEEGKWDYAEVGETVELSTDTDYVGPDASEEPEGYDNYLTTTAKADIIEAETTSLSADQTLNSEDYIDGGEGSDELAVKMNSDFNGFDDADTAGMVNVPNITLDNVSSSDRAFSANGIEGVESYTLEATDGIVEELSDLASAGISVELQDYREGDLLLGFTDAAKEGDNSVTLELNNVGTDPDDDDPTNVAVDTQKIENMTLESYNDTSNRVDLKNASDVEKLTADLKGNLTIADTSDSVETITAQGDGNLEISQIGTGVEKLQAGEVTGNITADLKGASSGSIQEAILGEGDSELTLNPDSTAAKATLQGGAGEDKIVFADGSKTLAPSMSGFQEMVTDDLGADTTFSLGNASDLTQATLKEGTGSDEVKLANLSGTAFTVTTQGAHSGGQVTYTAEEALTFNTVASDDAKEDDSTDTVSRDVTAGNTESLKVNVGENTNYDGLIKANSASTATLNVKSNEVDDEELTGFQGTLDVSKAEEVKVNAQGDFGSSSDAKIDAGSATNLNITAANGGTLTTDDGSLESVEEFILDTGDKFTLNSALDSAQNITLSGAASASEVVLDKSIGSKSHDNDVSLTATGLSSNLTTADIQTDSGNSISVDASAVDGEVTLGDLLVAKDGGALTGEVTVNLNGTGDAVTIGDGGYNDIQAETVNVKAEGMLGSLDSGDSDSGDPIIIEAVTANITGPGTSSSDFEVSAEEIVYTGGTERDEIKVEGTDSDGFSDNDGAYLDITTDLGENYIYLVEDGVTAAEDSSITGDVGDDTIKVNATSDLTNASISNIENITLSGGDLTLTGAQVEGFADNVSYTQDDSETIDLEIGTDAVDLSEVDSSFADVIGDVDFDENETTLTMTEDQFNNDSFSKEDNATIVVDESDATDAVTLDGSGLAADLELTGGSADDELTGGDGDDVINGGAGDDEINGGAGDDTITGGDGDDVINGGAGDDEIIGGKGVNTYNSSAGADTYVGTKGEKATFNYTDAAHSQYESNVDTFDFSAFDSNPADSNDLDLSEVWDGSSSVNVNIDRTDTTSDITSAPDNFNDDGTLDVFVNGTEFNDAGEITKATAYLNIEDNDTLDSNDMEIDLTGVGSFTSADTSISDFLTLA